MIDRGKNSLQAGLRLPFEVEVTSGNPPRRAFGREQETAKQNLKSSTPEDIIRLLKLTFEDRLGPVAP